MIAALWSRMWDMHDETKAFVFYNPVSMVKMLNRHLASSANSEKDTDIAGELENSPAESSNRVKPTKGGMDMHDPKEYTTRQKIGLILGPVLFLLMLLAPTPGGMSPEAKKMAAVTFLMATWWMCESLPIPATSLLPIPLFPMLGLLPMGKATAPYANPLIYLFMGGFIIALAMQRWNLHRRIAMNIVKFVGFSPNRLVLGFMVATAAISAFVSNTATAVMMMPIGMAIISHVTEEGKKEGLDKEIDFSPEHFHFGLNLMLGIAYAASIGGIATLIGTPPNTVLAGYISKTYGYDITFVRWLYVGIPLVVIFLPLCWLWLVKFAYPMDLKKVPGGKELINKELEEMGAMSRGERWTALVFCLTALCWIFQAKVSALFPKPEMVTDSTIAMFGAAILFMIPISLKNNVFVMDWHWAAKMPWGVLILFGGGLALADGFMDTGLAQWIGAKVILLKDSPILLLIIVVTIMVTFLTELTSNTATAAMVMPVLSAIAIGLGQNPLLLTIPAAIAASCAFMLPVSTPPNAIVFGSGYVTIPQMVKSGFGLNLMGTVLIVILTYALAMPVFGIHFGVLPDWATLPVK